MPNTLASATQPRDTSNLVPVTPPATPVPTLIASSADPEFSSLALAPIPPVLGTDTDAARQFYRSSVSQVRMPVLPAQSKIAVGAQAQSIAEEVVAGAIAGLTDQITLTMPASVFAVSGSPGDDIAVTFIDQSPHTFFMGPAVATVDKVSGDGGIGTSVISGQISTSQAEDFCICAVCVPNPNSRTITGGSGWGVDENIFITYSGSPSDDFYFLSESLIASAAEPVEGTASINVSSQWGAALACFNPVTGQTPVVLQTASGSNNSGGNPTTTCTATFTNPTTAGSVIVVAYNTQGYPIAVSDSLSNGYDLAIIALNANDAAADTAISYSVITTPGTTTVTITSPQAVPLTMFIYEVSNVKGLTGAVPTFRTPVGTDVTQVLNISGATTLTETLPKIFAVCSSGAGSYTVTLTDATSNQGQEIIIKNIGGNTVNVAAQTGQTIDQGEVTGNPFPLNGVNFYVGVISDGSNWWITRQGEGASP